MDHSRRDVSLLGEGLRPESGLPVDADVATLVGRVWRPDVGGPAVVTLVGDRLIDVSDAAPTISHLANAEDPLGLLDGGEDVGSVEEVLANSAHTARSMESAWMLAPIDLAPVKASGVTFAASLWNVSSKSKRVATVTGHEASAMRSRLSSGATWPKSSLARSRPTTSSRNSSSEMPGRNTSKSA